MSRDIFIQDLPANARFTSEIPDDFRPRPIGDYEDIVRAIRRAAPHANFTDPEWGTIDGLGYSIEVNIRLSRSLDGFALHVRGDGAEPIIAAILRELGLRALDGESATGEILDGSNGPSSQRCNN